MFFLYVKKKYLFTKQVIIYVFAYFCVHIYFVYAKF